MLKNLEVLAPLLLKAGRSLEVLSISGIGARLVTAAPSDLVSSALSHLTVLKIHLCIDVPGGFYIEPERHGDISLLVQCVAGSLRRLHIKYDRKSRGPRPEHLIPHSAEASGNALSLGPLFHWNLSPGLYLH